MFAYPVKNAAATDRIKQVQYTAKENKMKTTPLEQLRYMLETEQTRGDMHIEYNRADGLYYIWHGPIGAGHLIFTGDYLMCYSFIKGLGYL